MIFSKYQDLWVALLSGILIGASGCYFNYYYFSDRSYSSKPTFLSELQVFFSGSHIESEVNKRVKKMLSNECAPYKIYHRDRNRDGKKDVIYSYNLEDEGIQYIAEAREDQNFDGYFETRTTLDEGIKLWTEMDTNGDKWFDVEISYQHDIPFTVTFTDGDTGRVIKVNQLSMGNVVSTNIDTDRDGRLDTAYVYDNIGEITETYLIHEHPERLINY